MGLLPLSWVVVDAPLNRTEYRINGLFGRVMWMTEEGAVLRLVMEGGVAGEAWQIQPSYLREVSPWPPERFGWNRFDKY